MLCVTRIYLEHLERLCWRTTSDVIVGVVRKQSVTYDVNQNREYCVRKKTGTYCMSTDWSTLPLPTWCLENCSTGTRSVTNVHSKWEWGKSLSFDDLTVMDRHPLRKKMKNEKCSPNCLGGTTIVLYYMELFGYVRLLLTKTSAKTLTNSGKKKEGNPHGCPVFSVENFVEWDILNFDSASNHGG